MPPARTSIYVGFGLSGSLTYFTIGIAGYVGGARELRKVKMIKEMHAARRMERWVAAEVNYISTHIKIAKTMYLYVYAYSLGIFAIFVCKSI